MHIHLDLIGGLAGDMFIAALLDAFPEHEASVIQSVAALQASSIVCRVEPFADRVLQGRRFYVEAAQEFSLNPAAHVHTTWRSIQARIRAADLSPGIKGHALAIFGLLADAEGSVHGVPAEEVEFHEVGAWDSIADIVGAAALIHALAASCWTASPAPLGGGRAHTAHGELPVPAPATARLLLGMPTLDDGIGGERVTPTGAAILRYLCPPSSSSDTGAKSPASAVRRLCRIGTGFGARRLPGLSNHVRVLCFEPIAVSSGGQREISVLEFEVDDQSGEDLATGLDRLRAHAGVLDVVQTAVFGKKGRLMMHVRVLARQAESSAVVEACFRETTTIGLRRHTVEGIGLNRSLDEVCVDGHRLRVKLVERPGGVTAKTECDDVRTQDTHAERASMRQRAEAAALLERAVLDA